MPVILAYFLVLRVFGKGFGRPPLKMRTERKCAFSFHVSESLRHYAETMKEEIRRT